MKHNETFDELFIEQMAGFVNYVHATLTDVSKGPVTLRKEIAAAWINGAYDSDMLKFCKINEKILRATGSDDEFFDWMSNVKYGSFGNLCGRLIEYVDRVSKDTTLMDANCLWVDELQYDLPLDTPFKGVFDYFIFTFFNQHIREYAEWKLGNVMGKK